MNFFLTIILLLILKNSICFEVCHVNQENCKSIYDPVEGYKTLCQNKECEGKYKLKKFFVF